jgi:transcription elongation GreA/GreB family factor
MGEWHRRRHDGVVPATDTLLPAGLGSVVTVADRAGRVTEYELIAQSGPEDARQRVTLASATGRALLGARPGEYVRVTLANGRQRRVRVISVGSMPADEA